MTNKPLLLPTDYNPETYMIQKVTEFGTFHESRRGAQLAADLVENGTPSDLALAENVLNATLACQELDPVDPHYGNFYWMREDSVVEDLNAVEFVLESLIPMMLRNQKRLPNSLARRVLEAIRLGLAEIVRLDVFVAYTNITVLDILNSCLGGELLQDLAIAQRGRDKLANWIAFTDRAGHPLEYNSPTYGVVTLRALKQLSELSAHLDTCLRARTMTARLAVSVALHLHHGTGRWVGPHGRAYQPTVVCETPPEVELMTEWIASGVVPAWIEPLLSAIESSTSRNDLKGETIVETAMAERQLALTTFQDKSFTLGSATASFNPQSNVIMAHYQRPGAARPGVLYSRYILDNKWFGDAYHATDRTKTRNLPDEGSFFSVQRDNQILAIYGLTNANYFSSAKAVLIWTERAAVDEIWVDGEQVHELPAQVPLNATMIIGSGSSLMVVRPLHITPLGRNVQIQLVERAGDLVLEFYNYHGPAKRFWELNWPGAFFRGYPFVALYLEMAERGKVGSAMQFRERIEAGTFTQSLAEPFTYTGTEGRPYTLSYQRNHEEIGLSVDTMAWSLLRRWTEEGDLGWPMLQASMAQQTQGNHLSVNGTHLMRQVSSPTQGNVGSIWLVADVEAKFWVAGYMGTTPANLTLESKSATVQVNNMGTGLIIWHNGELSVEAAGEWSIE